MAKKVQKTARGDQYRAVLEKAGIRFEDCRVLAFTFLSDLGPQYCHYDMMMADPRPKYHLIDCVGETVYIIVPGNDAENERMCIQLAEANGGRKITPKLF